MRKENLGKIVKEGFKIIKDASLTELKRGQVEAGVIWRYQIGQRVKRDNKEGKIIKRYSKKSEVLEIFYPELYDVEWDDEQIECSFLAHGLRAI